MITLYEQCLRLSIADRIELCKQLQQSISDEWKGCRPSFLKSVMANILGVPEIPDDRRQEFTWARNMIAYQLLKEGMTEVQVGRILKKNHSTIHYMKKQMIYALDNPAYYNTELKIWEQFQEQIAR